VPTADTVAASPVPAASASMADLQRLARAQVTGRQGKRLASRIAKVDKQAAKAESAVAKQKTRRAKQRLRRVESLLPGVQKGVGPKKLKESSETIRLVLGDLVSGLRADTDVLVQDPSPAPGGTTTPAARRE
jgi:hypothetical protein